MISLHLTIMVSAWILTMSTVDCVDSQHLKHASSVLLTPTALEDLALDINLTITDGSRLTVEQLFPKKNCYFKMIEWLSDRSACCATETTCRDHCEVVLGHVAPKRAFFTWATNFFLNAQLLLISLYSDLSATFLQVPVPRLILTLKQALNCGL